MENNISKEDYELVVSIHKYLKCLDGIYSSLQSIIEIYQGNPKYRELFYWEDDILSSDKDLLLQSFVEEVHRLEIKKELRLLVEEGICDQGLDKDGKLVYFTTNNSEIDLIPFVHNRLKQKQ